MNLVLVLGGLVWEILLGENSEMRGGWPAVWNYRLVLARSCKFWNDTQTRQAMAKIIAYRVKQIYGTKTCLIISYNDAFQLVGFFVSDWLKPGFPGILSALRKGSKCAKPGRQVKIVALTSYFLCTLLRHFLDCQNIVSVHHSRAQVPYHGMAVLCTSTIHAPCLECD